MSRVVRVGEQKFNGCSGCKGVISGVPISVSIREVVENLRLRNSSVKSVKRMTRGVEKKEIETVLVEFVEKVLPKELYFGFLRYNVGEYVPKPLQCFNCQEFRHLAKVC